MSDGTGFMVAAYVLTVVVLSAYTIRLTLRRRAVARRLRMARDASRPSNHPAGVRDGAAELVGASRV